jgi:predicted peptidase
MRSLPFLLVAVVAIGCSTASQPSAVSTQPIDGQLPKTFSRTRTVTQKLDYLLFLPKGYSDKADQQWPLILFLHGAGERGSDLKLVTKHGPPKLVKDRPDFPFIVVSPQCPAGERWEPEAVIGLLDDVLRRYRVDAKRVYLTGLSMGGYGTWSTGVRNPHRFAAIAPICGGGTRIDVLLGAREHKEALQSLPVWAFHGAKDPVVPLDESQRMVEALKKAGTKDVKLTVYPEAQHDSWTQAYDDPKLFEWFLSHSK